MSDRWGAALLPDSSPDLGDPPGWLEVQALPPLPLPSMTQGPPVADQPFTYGMVARITLHRPGFNFRIEHDLPMGVQLVEARPKATVVGEHLIWQFGRIDPGQEVRLEIVVKPDPEIELDPTELANFTATYSQNLYFQAPVVRPRLAARFSGPVQVSVGDGAEFTLDIMSNGNWAVTDGWATVTLPAELSHPEGSSFRFELGRIKPGEYRRISIPVEAVRPGTAVLKAEVNGPADHHAVVEFTTRVTK
jgi:hypothetical protein